MATALKARGAVRELARHARVPRESEPMEFVIVEDNPGEFRWMILDGLGSVMARSDEHPSYADAGLAAQQVRAGVASARLGRRVDAAVPVDLAARCEARDAERWLYEGASFTDNGEARS